MTDRATEWNLIRGRHVRRADPAPLEPAVPPEFLVRRRGYDRGEVDEYVEGQRQRLATMRQRAQRAERELARLLRCMEDGSQASWAPSQGPASADDVEVSVLELHAAGDWEVAVAR